MTGLTTDEQKIGRERAKRQNIALIVEHVSRCDSSTCQSSNCQKMKSYLKHGSLCTVKLFGGCLLCKRVCMLLKIHAQQCLNDTSCPVQHCVAIRKRIRQLRRSSSKSY